MIEGTPYMAEEDILIQGQVFVLMDGTVSLVEDRTGSSVGIIDSNGVQWSWTDQRGAEHYLTKGGAQLIGCVKVKEDATRIDKMILIGSVVAKEVFRLRRQAYEHLFPEENLQGIPS